MNPQEPQRPEQPVTIGPALHHDEEVLRAALRTDADRLTPSDRLDSILAVSHEDSGRRSGRRPWLVPSAAAAAAAVVVVGGALLVSHRPPASSTLVGGPSLTAPTSAGATRPSTAARTTSARTTTGTATKLPTQPATKPASTTTPSAAPSAGATAKNSPARGTTVTPPGGPRVIPTDVPTSAPTSGATTPTAARVVKGVPVYYVGARPGGGQSLYREFVSAGVTSPPTPAHEVEAALALALGPPPSGSGYLAPWNGVRLSSVTLQPGEIRVGLTRGLTGVNSAQAKVAVQQLVYTAQAAAGQGVLPVRFTLGDGGPDLAPGAPASVTYTRPSDPGQVFTLLSPVWVDRPSRREVLPAAAKVTVTGVASTFEGSVSWQLRRGRDVVADGSVIASASAPSRGAFSIPLGLLPPADYVVRVFATSPRDGSVNAEQRVPFTLR